MQPTLPQNNPNQQAPPRPIQQQGNHHQESSGHSHNSYDTDSHGGHGNTNTGKGSYGGNWNYINSNDRNSVHHSQQGYSQSQDKDTQQR